MASRFSPAQIASAARQAGFRGQALTEIVAIALAESGGNPRARNPRGELSIGLTQININPRTAWGRERARRYGGERGLMDPVMNMRAAYDISQGGRNFRPWSVHRSSPSPHAGASNRFLRAASQAAGAPPQQLPTSGGRPGAAPSSAPGAARTAPSAQNQEALLRQQQAAQAAQAEAQREALEAQKEQQHFNRVLEVMGMMQQQFQSRNRPIQTSPRPRLTPDQFGTPALTERLQRLTAGSSDLTPGVARRSPRTSPQDRAAMLTGMERHIR